ncbi:type II toxin-antitoxin system Phd/YefM family antitoxin [Desulfococcus sp.]|uniref:type II toxin-antitoxin system Phd/YefM family antitoxin n=1 Tax=Desulfococcus sp. TaxID=2025834 RepID=UPI0035933C58
MMKIGIHEAKTRLSKLIPAVLAGEEVIITKSGKPLVKLVPVENPEGDRPLGFYADKIKFTGDILAPLPEAVISDFWLGEDADAVSS